MPSLNQINEITIIANQYSLNKGSIKINKISKGISFKNIEFYYEKRDFSLKNLNLYIKANNITALAGMSGSGKSTIIDLILGLQKPNKGVITLDDISYKKIDFNFFREQIGYIPQDPQLFNTTIKENLKWFNNDITENEMIEACKKSNAMEFINKLPKKFDTNCGNQGTNFSGGQRQRLTIARALLHKPNLLILDEATSALDSKSDFHIHKALSKLKRNMTIIVISHKLQTLKNADQIYVVNNGNIVQKGKFNFLFKDKKSIFFSMINKQL